MTRWTESAFIRNNASKWILNALADLENVGAEGAKFWDRITNNLNPIQRPNSNAKNRTKIA